MYLMHVNFVDIIFTVYYAKSKDLYMPRWLAAINQVSRRLTKANYNIACQHHYVPVHYYTIHISNWLFLSFILTRTCKKWCKCEMNSWTILTTVTELHILQCYTATVIFAHSYYEIVIIPFRLHGNKL